MSRPGSTPPPDAVVVSYANPTSSPVPLRGSAYARQFPAPPGSQATVYLDETGKVRYSDRSLAGLVEDAIDRQKERDSEAAKVPSPAASHLGPIFGPPAASDDPVEVAYAATMDRVERVRRQRPGLTVSEALIEIELYGAGKPETVAPTPADHQVERYGSHLGGKDRSADPGVLVAAWVPWATARNLAIPGGVDADSMHVTLAYLGSRSDFSDGEIETISSIVKEVAAETPPLKFEVSGTATFPASASSDGKEVLYAKVSSEALMTFRRHLVARLLDAGFSVDDRHGKYVPHITLNYVKPGQKLRKPSFAAATVSVREIKLAIGDQKKSFPLGTKTTEKYASSMADYLASINKPFIALHSPVPLVNETWQNARPPSPDVGSARLPNLTGPSGGGRTLAGSISRIVSRGRQLSGQLGDGGGNGRSGDRVMRGIVAELGRRKAAGSASSPGGGGAPPGLAGVAVPVPKPPAGSGPARAAAVAPTPAPAPDPRAGLPSQMRPDRTSDHSFLDLDPGPPKAPSSPVSTGRTATLIPSPPPAPNPAGRPSQMRPDKTSDVGTPRPMPSIGIETVSMPGDLPETRPAGILSPGQSMKGSVGRQNDASPSQVALEKVRAFISPPSDSIGGRENRSGLQSAPGQGGIKPVSAAPPVSALPRQSRSERDRARDGTASFI